MMTANTTHPEPQMDRAPAAHQTAADGIWFVLEAHVQLLDQVLDLIHRLHDAAPAGYVFGHKTGPHLRHVLEHYIALFGALEEIETGGTGCVDYDARSRNRLIETNPDAARLSIQTVQQELKRGQTAFPRDLATPLATRLTSGPQGGIVLTVPTSLGRELLFLESHTVHHMALLAEHVRGLGVALDPNFGKAPATIAFERAQSRAGH
jgi:uncharacterized damage-inducible protein DinB